MTGAGLIFYLLGIITVLATALAVTRTSLVHAVVYLVISFFSTALLFYLLGAPFLGALEVIIYAGAIMVLFLFIIMTMRRELVRELMAEGLGAWLPAMVMAALSAAAAVLMIIQGPGHAWALAPAMASPLAFGRFLFEKYWLPVEIASFLLFVALVGALYLGRREPEPDKSPPEDQS